jgi:hypothetical protein
MTSMILRKTVASVASPDRTIKKTDAIVLMQRSSGYTG